MGLVDMASHQAYAEILGNPLFPVIVLVTYHLGIHGEEPFRSNSSNLAEEGQWTAYLEEEKKAFRDLTVHLSSNYPGKTFVLQNREGDSALTDCLRHEPSDREKGRMAAWLSA